MITVDALRTAAKEAGLALVETLVQGSKRQPLYVTSKSFTRKMNRLCRRERHHVLHRTMQCAAAVLLALLLTGIGWLTFDAEARAAAVTWFRSISQNSIVYRFLNPAPQTTLPDYVPTWLPEGFEEQEYHKDDQRFSGFYTRDEDVIVIDISLYHSGSALSVYGSQDSAEELDLHGCAARYIPADETSSFNSLVWLDEDAGVLFSIGSTLDKDDILHIADWIKLSEFAKIIYFSRLVSKFTPFLRLHIQEERGVKL